jgi:hypothetical protein
MTVVVHSFLHQARCMHEWPRSCIYMPCCTTQASSAPKQTIVDDNKCCLFVVWLHTGVLGSNDGGRVQCQRIWMTQDGVALFVGVVMCFVGVVVCFVGFRVYGCPCSWLLVCVIVLLGSGERRCDWKCDHNWDRSCISLLTSWVSHNMGLPSPFHTPNLNAQW